MMRGASVASKSGADRTAGGRTAGRLPPKQPGGDRTLGTQLGDARDGGSPQGPRGTYAGDLQGALRSVWKRYESRSRVQATRVGTGGVGGALQPKAARRLLGVRCAFNGWPAQLMSEWAGQSSASIAKARLFLSGSRPPDARHNQSTFQFCKRDVEPLSSQVSLVAGGSHFAHGAPGQSDVGFDRRDEAIKLWVHY